MTAGAPPYETERSSMSKTVSRVDGRRGRRRHAEARDGGSRVRLRGLHHVHLAQVSTRARRGAGCTGYERLVTRWLQPLAPGRDGWKAGGAMEAASAPTSVLRRTRHLADRIGDGALYGITAAAAALALLMIAAIVWKVLEGAWPAIQEFGISFVWTSAWNPVIAHLRRARVHHRHARHLLRRAAPRRAALDRDRPLPERARAAGDPRSDRDADRDARGRAERGDRPLGHLRARAVPARPPRAVPRPLLRLDPVLQRRSRSRRACWPRSSC